MHCVEDNQAAGANATIGFVQVEISSSDSIEAAAKTIRETYGLVWPPWLPPSGSLSCFSRLRAWDILTGFNAVGTQQPYALTLIQFQGNILQALPKRDPCERFWHDRTH